MKCLLLCLLLSSTVAHGDIPVQDWAKGTGAAELPPPPSQQGSLPEPPPRKHHVPQQLKIEIPNRNQTVLHPLDRNQGFGIWTLTNREDQTVTITSVKIECACTHYQITGTTLSPGGSVLLVGFFDNRKIPPTADVGIFVEIQGEKNQVENTEYLALKLSRTDDSPRPTEEPILAWDGSNATHSQTVTWKLRSGEIIADYTPQTNPATAQCFNYTVRQDANRVAVTIQPKSNHPVAATWRFQFQEPDGSNAYEEVSALVKPDLTTHGVPTHSAR
jgi:hypothetical protein